MNENRISHGLVKNVHYLNRKKQAKIQWLQDPNQTTVDKINTVKPEASRHFINKRKKEYQEKRNILKLKLMNLKLTVRSKISET